MQLMHSFDKQTALCLLMVRSPTYDFAEEQNSGVKKIRQGALLLVDQFRSGTAFLKIVPYLSVEHNFMKNNLASFLRLH